MRATNLRVVASERGVTGIGWRRCGGPRGTSSINGPDAGPMLARAHRELREYFSGRLQRFSARIDMGGLSSFTQAVLAQTAKIPYGQTRTYTWIAGRLGKPKAARAVGHALARNPLPILIPWHRVVRKDGVLGRFVLGLKWKKRLLELEKRFVKTKTSSF